MAKSLNLACAGLIAGLLGSNLLPAQRNSPVQRDPEPVALTFCVYTTDKPSSMVRMFKPIARILQESVGRRLSRPVEIKLKIVSNYELARQLLITEQIDFIRFGPASYVLTKKAQPKIGLLAMETIEGKKTFEGYIVVRNRSSIRELGDLKGRSFAFGDPTSTIGRYLAQELLLNAGIREKDLSKFSYLSRHDIVFSSVEHHRFDAGAVKSSTFHKLNKEGQLRILARFDNVTKPWVCRAGLPAEQREALSQALLHLNDVESLKTLKADSFTTASDKDYDVIRRSMLAAENFSNRSPQKRADRGPATSRPKPSKD